MGNRWRPFVVYEAVLLKKQLKFYDISFEYDLQKKSVEMICAVEYDSFQFL